MQMYVYICVHLPERESERENTLDFIKLSKCAAVLCCVRIYGKKQLSFTLRGEEEYMLAFIAANIEYKMRKLKE